MRVHSWFNKKTKMPLNLYTSNRMELLVEYLSHVLDQNKLSPLESEVIIVQSQGMARFLAMELAQRSGVWAGGGFPFPNAFLQDVFALVLEGETTGEAWQRSPLAWRIFTLLPSLLTTPGFEVLESYCQTPTKTFQLSQQVADLFDQYVLYRSEMIRDWTAGKDQGWQAVLWRRLLNEIASPHRADQFDAVLKKIGRGFSGKLPKRIALFGISSMAPRIIDLFAALGAHIEVNVFFLNPCEEEWSEIMAAGSITRTELTTGVDRGESFLENGNELLASMGHLGRDFADLIQAYDPVVYSLFVPAEETSLLAAIQNNILHLESPTPINKLDGSLHCTSCHNGMREVEVLLDHLLHLLNNDPELEPRDILVMAPDIGLYVPLVEAVFRTGDNWALPYSVADQSMQEQEIFSGFSLLIETAKGRWRVTEIMALMEVPAISRRFGFVDDDLVLIRQWLAEVHIHWGRDQHHREDLGLPPSSAHSFRQGINRLLLGFAMAGDDLFMGMLPFQSGDLDGDVAARFLVFYERLLAFSCFLEGDKDTGEWSRGLLSALDDFFLATSEEEWQVTQLRTILGSLVRDADLGGCRQTIVPEIIDIWLKKSLNLDLSPYGFLSGGITFCSLLPMRAIPFKVVCLLGMNDGDFPRTQIRPGFDLMARDYQKGDRLKRNDDRYLFLEALLSARNQLYISWVGRSMTDNRELLPSVLVSELLEYVQDSVVEASGDSIVQHPIQPFNPDYFTGVLSPSFSRENYDACVSLSGAEEIGADFLAGLKVNLDTDHTVLALGDVLHFWQNPAAFFCKKSLGLVWPDQESPLEDDEPFELSGLGKYQLASDCVDLLILGGQPQPQKIHAEGILPQGVVGDMALAGVLENAGRLVAQLAPKTTSKCPEVQTTIQVGGYDLEVRLAHLYTTGQVFMRVSGKIDGRHLIRAWLQHLVLQEIDAECEKTTFLVASEELVIFEAVENSGEILKDILYHYQRGLCLPLPFFAKSSWLYAMVAAEKGTEAGLKKARAEFNPDHPRFSPESADPAISRCFGAYELADPFMELARKVFDPMLQSATLDLVR